MESKDAVDALIEALKDEDWGVRNGSGKGPWRYWRWKG